MFPFSLVRFSISNAICPSGDQSINIDAGRENKKNIQIHWNNFLVSDDINRGLCDCDETVAELVWKIIIGQVSPNGWSHSRSIGTSAVNNNNAISHPSAPILQRSTLNLVLFSSNHSLRKIFPVRIWARARFDAKSISQRKNNYWNESRLTASSLILSSNFIFHLTVPENLLIWISDFTICEAHGLLSVARHRTYATV